LNCLGYGIALPKGSIWRDKISLAILELQEKGEIQMLYDKWWKKTEDACKGDEKQKETTKANSLVCNNFHFHFSFPFMPLSHLLIFKKAACAYTSNTILYIFIVIKIKKRQK
jgi:ionotropic kainate glutamate receptor 2